MGSYSDNYFKRLELKGKLSGGSQDSAKAWGQAEFQRWFAQSPTRETVVVNGEDVECSIQSNRFRDDRAMKYMVLPHDVAFPLGSLLQRKNGEIWILFRHEPHTLEFDNRYVIYECKHEIQWVTKTGVIEETPCLLVGPLENSLQENFRTWNKLVTPQTNKTLEVIMPKMSLDREARISIFGETWRVSEYDITTLPGIMFVTLEEAKRVTADDVLDLADSDKLDRIEIVARNFPVFIREGKLSPINAWLEMDGLKVEDGLEFSSEHEQVEIHGDKVIISMGGSYTVTATCKLDPRITKKLGFVVSNTGSITKRVLEGPNSIRWGKEGTYEIFSYVNTTKKKIDAEILLEDTELATIEKKEDKFVVKPTQKNTGEITLTAKAEGETLTKKVQINSIWG